jgi:hypothetical protein
MSPPFADDEDAVSTGERSSEDIVFSGWDDSDKLYLELDFAPFDLDDEDLP